MKRAGHWLTRPATIARLWIAFAAVLALTVVAGFLVERHGYFGLDATPAFNAWYGFGACVAMILVARVLGVALKRRDDYYDDDHDR
jgi:hypothetical protein